MHVRTGPPVAACLSLGHAHYGTELRFLPARRHSPRFAIACGLTVLQGCPAPGHPRRQLNSQSSCKSGHVRGLPAAPLGALAPSLSALPAFLILPQLAPLTVIALHSDSTAAAGIPKKAQIRSRTALPCPARRRGATFHLHSCLYLGEGEKIGPWGYSGPPAVCSNLMLARRAGRSPFNRFQRPPVAAPTAGSFSK